MVSYRMHIHIFFWVDTLFLLKSCNKPCSSEPHNNTYHAKDPVVFLENANAGLEPASCPAHCQSWDEFFIHAEWLAVPFKAFLRRRSSSFSFSLSAYSIQWLVMSELPFESCRQPFVPIIPFYLEYMQNDDDAADAGALGCCSRWITRSYKMLLDSVIPYIWKR